MRSVKGAAARDVEIRQLGERSPVDALELRDLFASGIASRIQPSAHRASARVVRCVSQHIEVVLQRSLRSFWVRFDRS